MLVKNELKYLHGKFLQVSKRLVMVLELHTPQCLHFTQALTSAWLIHSILSISGDVF